MTKYLICINGCDDVTEFEMELSEDEIKTVVKICLLSQQTSTYRCMPVMKLRAVQGEVY